MLLTTRYPGLRRFFQHEGTEPTEAPRSTVSQFWARDEGEYTREWKFFLDFAEFCVSRNEAAEIVERKLPSQLGSLSCWALERGAIENLLVLVST